MSNEVEVPATPTPVRNWMSNGTYDVMKFIAQVILPALGTFYFALAALWGFGYGEEVVGTIMALDALLGVTLGISSIQFKKNDANLYNGQALVNITDITKPPVRLVLDSTLEDLVNMKSISFKVVTDAPPASQV